MTSPCYYHPGVMAADACLQCGIPLCVDCRERVSEKSFCKRCVAAVRQRVEQQMAGGSYAAGPMPAAVARPATVGYGGSYVAADPQDQKRMLIGIALAVVVSLLFSLLWEKMMFYLGWRLPFMFIGMGVATGYVFHKVTGRGGASVAIIPAAVMLVCMLLAHLLLAEDVLNVAHQENPSLSFGNVFPTVMSHLPAFQWISIIIGLGWCYRSVEQQEG